MSDIISLLAGLSPGDPADRLRELRPQARANAQLSFEAICWRSRRLASGTWTRTRVHWPSHS